MTPQPLTNPYEAHAIPVWQPTHVPPEPVTPDSPEPNEPPLPDYQDEPPVKPIAGSTERPSPWARGLVAAGR